MADTGRTVFADGLFADDFWAAGLWAADEPVAVPDVDDPGTAQADAVLAIEGAGLVANVVTAYSSVIPVGEVISQDPAAGTLVSPGSTVTITVSLGDAPQPSGGSFPVGGGGGRIWYQGKRRKRLLIEQPERHLKSILNQVEAEVLYREAVKDKPEEAAAIVRPFSKSEAAEPPVQSVDWTALEQDRERVGKLFHLWFQRMQRKRRDEEWLLLGD